MRKRTSIRRMCMLAGLSIMAVSASAAWIPLDAQIKIDRALNSPTITVRYTGVSAALVELRINGESLGTRSVSADASSGETNFTIDLNALRDGDNPVEIRLFDRTGKLVGSDKTNISTFRGNQGPVFLRTPQNGESLQGTTEISVGFGRELRNVYVSFFVNNDFKRMTNFPPYTFNWDTTSVANGWHDIEAWVIDDTSTTFKTARTRVFVNNPGGRTERRGVEMDLATRGNALTVNVEGNEAGTRTASGTGTARASDPTAVNLAPALTPTTVNNTVRADVVDSSGGTKPVGTGSVVASDIKHLTPTGTRIAVTPTVTPTVVPTVTPTVAPTVPPAAVTTTPKLTTTTVATTQGVSSLSGVTRSVTDAVAATGMLSITKGQRIPNIGSFAVVLNSQFVNFDVSPRVDEGIPMTPFRHLLEKAGGTVDWENLTKTVKANAEGQDITIQIGDPLARINDMQIRMERAPYLERGRTIVPLTFLSDVLNVQIDFDRDTGHVLITTKK
jgi:hypothetical protein